MAKYKHIYQEFPTMLKLVFWALFGLIIVIAFAFFGVPLGIVIMSVV